MFYESEIRFRPVSELIFHTVLAIYAEKTTNITKEIFKELYVDNCVLRRYNQQKEDEWYTKKSLNRVALFPPSSLALYISEETPLANVSNENVIPKTNVERTILKFDTYEWHFKKKETTARKPRYTIEIEFNDHSQPIDKKVAIDILIPVLTEHGHLFIASEIRGILATLLGRFNSPDDEVSSLALHRPHNVTRSVMQRIMTAPENWLIAAKHDGIYTLVAMYNKVTFLINDKIAHVYLEDYECSLVDLIKEKIPEDDKWRVFEGEMIGQTLYVFDLLYISKCIMPNAKIRHEWLPGNLRFISSAVSKKVKTFTTFQPSRKNGGVIEDELPRDGFIFLEKKHTVTGKKTGLYRSKSHPTVDVLLRVTKKSNFILVGCTQEWSCWLYDVAKTTPEEMKISTFITDTYTVAPFSAPLMPDLFNYTISFSKSQDRALWQKNQDMIFEVFVDTTTQDIRVIQPRPAKKIPNNFYGVLETLHMITLTFDEEVINPTVHFHGTSTHLWYHFRYASSTARRLILQQNVSDNESVVDLGAGRGASITLILETHKLNHILLVDQDCVGLSEAQERLYRLKQPHWQTLNILVADYSQAKGIISINEAINTQKYDVIFSINAIHYAATTEHNLALLLNAIKDSLPVGGRVVLIFPDSERIAGFLKNKNRHVWIIEGVRHFEISAPVEGDSVTLGTPISMWREYAPKSLETEPACPASVVKHILVDASMRIEEDGDLDTFLEANASLVLDPLKPEEREVLGFYAFLIAIKVPTTVKKK